jgi:hypothetical protein
MENEINQVKEMIKNHATHFLKEMKEFYPFGVQLENDGSLRPVNIYESEYPESQILIDKLNDYFEEQIINKTVKVVGLGLDIFYTPTDSDIKKTAIQIRIYHVDGISRTYYIVYYIDNEGDLSFEEEFFE